MGYGADALVPGVSPTATPLAHSPFVALGTPGVADMVTFGWPSGSQVFATGTIQWSWGLDDYLSPGVSRTTPAQAAVQRITRNVLERMATPGLRMPVAPLRLDEDFSGPQDPGRWTLGALTEGAPSYDPQVQVLQTGGRLQVIPRSGVGGLHHGGYVSAGTFDLTAGYAKVELVQPTNPASSATTVFGLVTARGEWCRFAIEGSWLVSTQYLQGALSNTKQIHDAIQHRHLRLRASPGSGLLLFETSPDDRVWLVHRAMPLGLDLRAVRVELGAGTYQAEAAPGMALFDNLRLVQEGCADQFPASRDPRKWTPDLLTEDPASFDPGLVVFQRGKQLHLRVGPSGVGARFAGYVSTARWDLTGREVRVEVVQAAGPTRGVRTALAVSLDRSNYYRVSQRGGTLSLEQVVAGAASRVDLPYHGVDHRFWRLRHLVAGNSVLWETSPNGILWTIRRSATTSVPVSGVRVELSAGSSQPESAPTEAIFANFFLGS